MPSIRIILVGKSHFQEFVVKLDIKFTTIEFSHGFFFKIVLLPVVAGKVLIVVLVHSSTELECNCTNSAITERDKYLNRDVICLFRYKWYFHTYFIRGYTTNNNSLNNPF